MALFRRGDTWWYEFLFARQRVRESAKTTSKTVAKQAEQNRRRELERGFNGVEDVREDRVRTVKAIATEYLEQYCLRNKVRRLRPVRCRPPDPSSGKDDGGGRHGQDRHGIPD